MTRRAAAGVVLALLLSAALPAEAFPGFRGEGRGGAQMQQRSHAPQRERQFQPPQRDEREAQRPQRMTPDERRELRRELRDAGRDIYPQRRDWRR